MSNLNRLGYCDASGKVQYSSENAARMNNRKVAWRLRVYRCPTCWKWHVTNSEKRENQWRDRP